MVQKWVDMTQKHFTVLWCVFASTVSSILLTTLVLLLYLVYLTACHLKPKFQDQYYTIGPVLVSVIVLNALFHQQYSVELSIVTGYSSSRMLTLQAKVNLKYQALWLSLRELITAALLLEIMFSNVASDTIPIICTALWTVLVIGMGFMSLKPPQVIFEVAKKLSQSSKESKPAVVHSVWDNLIEKGIDSWFLKVQTQNHEIAVGRTNKNLETFLIDQQWTDNDILTNIKGISQANMGKYLAEQEFDFNEQDTLAGILKKLTEEDVQKELKEKQVPKDYNFEIQSVNSLRSRRQTKKHLSQAPAFQFDLASMDLSQVVANRYSQNDVSKILVVQNLSSSYSLNQSPNADMSFFVNRRGQQPLLIFPAALILEENVYVFVLVRIIQFLEKNELQYYVTVDNFHEQLWQKMHFLQCEQRLNLSYEFIQRQAINMSDLIRFVKDHTTLSRAMDRQNLEKVGTQATNHLNPSHSPKQSQKQFSFNEPSDKLNSSIYLSKKSINQEPVVEHKLSDTDGRSNRIVASSSNICDQIYLKTFLMTHDNFNFLELFGEAKQDKNKFSILALAHQVISKLKRHPLVACYEIKIKIVKCEVKHQVYNHQRKVEIMLLNMLLISVMSFCHHRQNNKVKIRFQSASEHHECIHVIVSDNGDGYQKFQVSNLQDANLYIIGAFKLCSSIAKESSYIIANQPPMGLRQEVMLFRKNRQKAHHVSLKLNQIVIKDTDNISQDS